MKCDFPKPVLFLYRFSRNILGVSSIGRKILFPPHQLAEHFGPENGEYAWSVFLRHLGRLRRSGFAGASRILEVGPGRNLGTALLFGVYEMSRLEHVDNVSIVLWDVFPNAKIYPRIWEELARTLLECKPVNNLIGKDYFAVLSQVAEGQIVPEIQYVVCHCRELPRLFGMEFELVYSQAVLEHAWDIAKTWDVLAQVTVKGGWHSHRVDLADHGRRETNYLEMCEWSTWSYWLTMRFIPGAINRWRACHHIEYLRQLGFEILMEEREFRSTLPRDRKVLARPFQSLDEKELRTTGLDIVARAYIYGK